MTESGSVSDSTGSDKMIPGVNLSEVGIIFGNVSTNSFEISITDTTLEKMDYIQVFHDVHGWILGQVDNIERKTNLSIEQANKISDGEDVAFKERLSAKITVLGFRDERGLLQSPKTPFKAGEGVYRAKEQLIMEVVGLKESPGTGAYIGLLSGHSIKVYLDINLLVQKHVSVLAKTGGGKSYMAGAIIEELMKHGVTTVILDPHGEYNAMRKSGKKAKVEGRDFGVEPRGYADNIIEFSPDTKTNKGAKHLCFTLGNMNARQLLALTPIKKGSQYIRPLQKAIDLIQGARRSYTLTDLIRILEAEEDNNTGPLIGGLEYLRSTKIFEKQGTKIDDLVQKGVTTVINLRGVEPDIAELVVQRIATALFELRKLDKIPPLMLVAEEAHNWCPQQGTRASSEVFKTIAAEGRKFGLGLLVISQRAAKVDKSVLSQCNTQIILKVTNPNDLKAITASVEGITMGTADEIQRLPVGVALVTGGGLSMPLFVDVRPRESMHGGESVTVLE